LSSSRAKELVLLGALQEVSTASKQNAKQLNSIIRWGVDSCAAAAAINKERAATYPTYVDAKTGRSNTVADGRNIADEGVKLLVGSFGGQARKAMKARVCETQRPLPAVGELVDGDRGVLFCKSGSSIMDERTAAAMQRTAARMNRPTVPVTKRSGVFKCDMKLEVYDWKVQAGLKKSQGVR